MNGWIHRNFATPTITRIVVICVAICTFSFLVANWLSVRTVDRLSDSEAIELVRNRLVDSCERNGNDLRAALTQNIQVQINQARGNIGLTHKFFPNIPLPVLKRLTEERINSLERQQARVGPVDCASVFPKPE